jgi:hypothetical protein
MKMTKVLLLAAGFALSVSVASACDFMKSASVDRTVVASVKPTDAKPMSASETVIVADATAQQEAPVEIPAK